jgi:hypothetical protein
VEKDWNVVILKRTASELILIHRSISLQELASSLPVFLSASLLLSVPVSLLSYTANSSCIHSPRDGQVNQDWTTPLHMLLLIPFSQRLFTSLPLLSENLEGKKVKLGAV